MTWWMWSAAVLAGIGVGLAAFYGIITWILDHFDWM